MLGLSSLRYCSQNVASSCCAYARISSIEGSSYTCFPSIKKNRHKHLAHGEMPQDLGFVALFGMVNTQRLRCVDLFLFKGNQVCECHAAFRIQAQNLLIPGFVIFTTFSLSLIFGISFPSTISAAILYTPPNAGQSREVISFVPTAQMSILSPAPSGHGSPFHPNRPMQGSLTSECPASSNMARARLERYAKSPESNRMPTGL